MAWFPEFLFKIWSMPYCLSLWLVGHSGYALWYRYLGHRFSLLSLCLVTGLRAPLKRWKGPDFDLTITNLCLFFREPLGLRGPLSILLRGTLYCSLELTSFKFEINYFTESPSILLAALACFGTAWPTWECQKLFLVCSCTNLVSVI